MVILVSEDSYRYAHLFQIEREYFGFNTPESVVVARCLLGSQCCLSTGLVANGIRLTKCCNALLSRSDVTHGLPDLRKSFTLLVCVCFLTSHQTTV